MRYDLPHEYLLSLLDYNPDTGKFIWKNSLRPGHNGKAAGKIGGGAYNYAVIGIRFNGIDRNYGISRLAWFYVHAVWPTRQLRFVNGDASDARISNLIEREPAKRRYRMGKPAPTTLPSYQQKYNHITQRRAGIKYRYGITAERYAEMLETQNGTCAICSKPETIVEDGVVRQLAVDHDHATGDVRGLLCGRCNSGLGYFNDDPALMARAIGYIRHHTNSGDNVVPLKIAASGDGQ